VASVLTRKSSADAARDAGYWKISQTVVAIPAMTTRTINRYRLHFSSLAASQIRTASTIVAHAATNHCGYPANESSAEENEPESDITPVVKPRPTRASKQNDLRRRSRAAPLG